MKLYIIGTDKKFISLLQIAGAVGIEIDEKDSLKSIVKTIRTERNSIGALIVESSLIDKYPRLQSFLDDEEIAWTSVPSKSEEITVGMESLEALAEKTLGMKINVS